MNDTNWVWYIVVIVIALGLVSLQEGNEKSRVKSLLEEKGFQQIKVTTKMFTGIRGTITFNVEYCNKNGVLQENTCVIHTNVFSDGKIYWEKPLH